MGRRFFVKPSSLATASAVLSASSQDGLAIAAPVSAATNKGALRLRASCDGAPLAAGTLNLALQTGGLANGLYTTTDGTPGATLRWKNSADAATEWRGHTDNAYVTMTRVVAVGTAATKYPCVSEPRRLRNGSIGFVRTKDGVVNTLDFVSKPSRTGAWSTSFILSAVTTDVVSVSVRPALVVLPSGRLLVFAYMTTTDTVDAFYSDDHGATWAQWSTATNIACNSTNSIICAEVTGDSVCVITGGDDGSDRALRVHWSLDAGQTFTLTASETSSQSPRTCVTATGSVLVAYAVSGATSGTLYPVLFGGGLGASLTTYSVQSGNPQVALVGHDDGSLWLFNHGYTADPLTAINHEISLDNGATWGGVSSTTAIYDNGTGPGTPVGPRTMVAGSFDGAIVLLLSTDTTSATFDEGIIEMWVGGWDSLTETYSSSSEGTGGTNLYNALSYIADDLPDNLGWTRTNVGAGATVTQTVNGLNIAASALVNSVYQIDPGGMGTAEGFRMRYVFRVNSGGDLANSVAVVGASVSDTVNRQWWRIRHEVSQIRLIDQSGTVATSSMVLNQFTEHTEVFVAWAHDYPSAGGGTISVYYRKASENFWRALAENKPIAEQAANNAEGITIGGLVSGTAVDWDISYLGLAEGAASRMTGFTNPTHLHGRPISSAVDCMVTNGVKVGGFGYPGIQADTYTLATTYNYAASNIWRSQRLSDRWQTAAHNTAANVVLYSAGNAFRCDVVTLHGTNFRRATLQFNTSDSWASPARSALMDATVWQGSILSSVNGHIAVAGKPWRPHQFRSESGRRWFLEIAGAPATVYEITDNDEDALYVANLPSGQTGALSVFGDRMGVVLEPSATFAYARVSIASQPTADSKYRLGFVAMAIGHEVVEDNNYDSGFTDSYIPITRTTETIDGQVSVAILGPEHHELRIAWALKDRSSSDYLDRVSYLFRALRGEAGVVAFWRDADDPSTLGLYRVQGPVVRENAYGELGTALDRLAQVVLREVTT